VTGVKAQAFVRVLFFSPIAVETYLNNISVLLAILVLSDDARKGPDLPGRGASNRYDRFTL
jgi:hypothetical protein